MSDSLHAKMAIIVVGYNRPKAVQALLNSIIEAEYGDIVDLIISIDKGQRQDEIAKIGEEVSWTNGNKKIIKHKERLGLKKHILTCGNLTNQYDAIIVLEDDLTVSRGFYQYAKQAVEKYSSDDNIAGISLYSYHVIPYSSRFFIPENNGYDTYCTQGAMSWGQCWTTKMWKDFYDWYLTHCNEIPTDGRLPTAVTNWDDRSWLKYYDRYLVESGKYFIMPYISLSTNHTAVGEHAASTITMFEVPLLSSSKDFVFPSFEKAVKYDAFFERNDIDFIDLLKLDGSLLVDLNGIRDCFDGFDYAISTQVLPYDIIKSFGVMLRPIECNVMQNIQGTGIYLYNLNNKRKLSGRYNYNYLAYSLFDAEWRDTLVYSIIKIAKLFLSRKRK